MPIMFAGSERATRKMGIDRHREVVDANASGDSAHARRTILEHMEAAAETLVS